MVYGKREREGDWETEWHVIFMELYATDSI